MSKYTRPANCVCKSEEGDPDCPAHYGAAAAWPPERLAAVFGFRRQVEPTVKRADLFGNVVDIHATEAELNGFRPTNGRLF